MKLTNTELEYLYRLSGDYQAINRDGDNSAAIRFVINEMNKHLELEQAGMIKLPQHIKPYFKFCLTNHNKLEDMMTSGEFIAYVMKKENLSIK